MAAGGRTLSSKAVNRATLDRQLLLSRSTMSPSAAIERLCGMQAQAPFPPYTGLWSRLAGFGPDDLARLLLDRSVVRIVLMRGTVHLVTADDCLAFRPALQEMLDRMLRGSYGRQLVDLDLDEVSSAARAWVEECPLPTGELGARLTERWPEFGRQALLNVVRTALPLVQTPPRAVWGRSGQTTVTTAESWLGRPLAGETAPDRLVLRYLAGFGPASVQDIQRWSGLTRLREVVDRLRPGLLVLRAEEGGELFDLPDAPRPGPDVPAPVRFLPEFDNLLLSYADGRRIMAAEHRPELRTANGLMPGTVLVDGTVQAVWRIERTRAGATLHVRPFLAWPAETVVAVELEGRGLLAFVAPEAEPDVRITSCGGR